MGKTALRNKVIKPDKLAVAIRLSGGNITNCAERLGVHRKTLWAQSRKNPELLQVFVDYESELIDRAEDVLRLLAFGIPKFGYNKIEHDDGRVTRERVQVGWRVMPNLRALELILNAKAQDRGYGQQRVITDTDGPTHVMIVSHVVSRDTHDASRNNRKPSIGSSAGNDGNGISNAVIVASDDDSDGSGSGIAGKDGQ